MTCIKFVFYLQEENFVVQFSIENINRLILFYFQWKKRYIVKAILGYVICQVKF